MSYCVACDNRGCERCRGGPGEQGFSLDEKELLEVRERHHQLVGLVIEVELASRAGVGCPWCGAPKGQHAENCRAFSGPGQVRGAP